MKYRSFQILIFIPFISILIFLTSCSSLKECTKNNKIVELTDSNIEILNGRYAGDSFLRKDSVSGNLHWNFFDRGYNNEDTIEFIELKAITPERILVHYYDGLKIIRTKEFRGKVIDDYFVLKRKRLIIPALYVNLFRNRRFRIGLLKNNNLITDYHQISFGTVIFISPFYENKKEFDTEFKRLKK